MSSNNSTPNNEWVRLNVGGKVFETTKDTLSTHPESFLARLTLGNIPSEKDESGAFRIDRSYEHFDTILNYFRSGVVNLDRNEKAMKDLLCEADFYNIQPLVDEIQKAMRPVTSRSEIVIVSSKPGSEIIDGQNVSYIGCLIMSENRKDYQVLQALRQKIEIKTKGTTHYIISPNYYDTAFNIELTLRNFGFVKEEICVGELYDHSTSVKFVRTICQ
ncbi:BTB/POZ domain-containing protein [Ditylenchus destructor]|nr:BTB/POZ domain-containing protein [Ditylenchus destructor]